MSQGVNFFYITKLQNKKKIPSLI